MLNDILEELKNAFNLKKNHILILQLLSSEECTADEICDRTGIPKGRIYNLLNELIDMHLIERRKGVPAVYNMNKPTERILDFLKYDFSNEVRKQTKIISLLEKKTRVERVEIMNDNKTYDYNIIAQLVDAKWVKVVHRESSLAWFIQPRDEKEFWEVREEINKRRRAATSPSRDLSLLKYRAYLEVYKEKDIEQIMCKSAFDSYVEILRGLYGDSKVKEWSKNLLKDLDTHKNVKLYVQESEFSVFNTHISDRGVLLVLLFRDEISGMRIIGKRTSDLYERYFEELKTHSEPMEKYLKKLI
jgi:sugar-specific transcriptional regulator TrmB